MTDLMTVLSQNAPQYGTIAALASRPPDTHTAQMREAFDKCTLGIIEADLDQKILYANPAALEMAGRDTYVGVRLIDLVPDEEARRVLTTQRIQRRAGMIGNYRVVVTRKSDGKPVPIEITGVPLFDANGTVRGSLGVLQSRQQQQLVADIHRLNRKGQSADALLRKVARRLQQDIPFDLIIVTRYSADCRHADSFFMYASNGPWKSHQRWFPITKAQVAWINRPNAQLTPDIEQALNAPPWDTIKDDEFVLKLLRDGFKSSLFRAVHRPGGLAGAVSLLSRKSGGLTERHRVMLDEIPIDTTLLHALELTARREADRRSALLMLLSRCTTVQDVSRVLVEQLRDIFGWSHVSLYYVDHVARRIRLIAQQSTQSHMVLPDGYEQEIGAGVLGRVVRTRSLQNITNVNHDPDFLRVVTSSGVISELAVPIMYEGLERVRWIINVEDTQANAFSTNESAALAEIAREVGALMERISQLYFLQQCFDRTSDPVFVTGRRLEIIAANPAASKLLKLTGQKIGSAFADLFADADAQARLSGPAGFDLGKFALRYASGPEDDPASTVSTIPLYVSRNSFPEALGGYIFIVRDIDHIRRDEERQLLGEAAYGVAIETSSPLTLAVAEVEKLCTAGTPLREPLEKIHRQLTRVKRAYTKLATFNPQARPQSKDFSFLRLRAELDAVIATLPADLSRLVRIEEARDLPEIRADHVRVGIVIETLLAILLRSAPENARVYVDLACAGGFLEMRFRGYLCAGAATPSSASLEPRSEITLAAPLLAQFMDDHHGAFESRAGGNGMHEFIVRFPMEAAS